MNTSPTSNNGSRRPPGWFRRGHRWVGVSLLVFVVLLSITGITLNHGGDLGLDRRYVNWSWMLDAYGIQMPPPSASFADDGHRATLIGERLFIDGRDTELHTEKLKGFATLGSLVIAAGERAAYLLTVDGDLVEAIALASLPGSIERVGRIGGRAVVQSGGVLLRSDLDIAVFEPWSADTPDAIQWPVETAPDASEMQALERAYRGRGLTVERVLLDLHSGRIVGMSGPLLMDIVGVCLIVLGFSGLIMSRSRSRRENGGRNGSGPRN